MKKLFPLIALLFSFALTAQDSYIGAFSNGAGLSDSRLLDAVADFTSKMRNKMVLASNIKGSPYFEDGFQKGRLDYFGRDVKGDAFFRYNAYNDEIEIGEFAEQKEAEEALRESEERHAAAMDAIMIATCCHHRCVWDAYPNRPFLQQLGFGPVRSQR